MTGTRWDMGNISKVAEARGTINSATTTSFDFGTPDDINTANLSGYSPGDRILVACLATTTGTTDSLTWVLQDADDSSGSIGTPATAVSNAVAGALAAGTSNDASLFAVKLQPGRPWLRIRFTSSGATDTFATSCVVMAVPNNA